jgi:hypothetical protein
VRLTGAATDLEGLRTRITAAGARELRLSQRRQLRQEALVP